MPQMAALAAAKAAFDANDLNGAKAQLQWVVDNGSDDEYKSLAALRLAGVLLDEKAYDEGLKVLSADVPAAVRRRRGRPQGRHAGGAEQDRRSAHRLPGGAGRSATPRVPAASWSS